jgi:putative membrane protein
VASGAAQSASGAKQAATGAEQSASGASSLSQGLDQLQTGATSLSDGLVTGAAKVPSTDAAARAAQSAAIGNPVSVKTDAVTKATDYGAGLAPFFISLAAWIGIYALFLIVKPLSRRALTAVRRPIRIALAGWLAPAILGVVQMAAVFLIVALALRLDVGNPLATYGFMALASLTFAAIILALNAWLGSVGQFLGLVLMVVQLVTAGGTFPWQTLPGPLAALHHALPMSYAVDGLRQLMYGGSATTALSDALVLLCWLLGGVAITALAAVRMTRHRTLRDLRPSLIG